VRQLGVMARTTAIAVTAAFLRIAAGATAAGAAARQRSGTARAQLVNRVTAGAPAGRAGYAPDGAHVMAAMVAVAGLLAFGFIVVTIIRRRVRTTG
jgi:hypothetical protein